MNLKVKKKSFPKFWMSAKDAIELTKVVAEEHTKALTSQPEIYALQIAAS